MDRFPADLLADIRNIQRAVDQASLAKGRPLTTASAGWILPNMPTPDNPANGVHLFAQENTLYALSASGALQSIPDQASAVSNPAPPTATTIGANPTSTDYNKVVADLNQLYAALFALMNSFRAAGFLST
ncbi:hypothetical protein [Streptosporangium sp. G12]